ncbi:MAG TPA: cation:proton antiporter domain-containing protein [Candidatus Wunengus sp. YC63]|uniref:cation:proton antiporter domain-containing protein n=1 Tax=Candidatus Wunengus sp. YC63 TaxID=3367699 RepID=UPI004024FEA0
MIPRGVVGLICAQVGLSTSILTQKTFTALVITIMVTVLITPPMLKRIIRNTTP